MQPVAEKLVWHSDVRSGVFYPIKMRRDEPGVIDLPGNLPLDILKRLLPDRIDTHKSEILLYTGLFTPVDNVVFGDGCITLDDLVNTMSLLLMSSCVFTRTGSPQGSAKLHGVFPEELHKFIRTHGMIFCLPKQHDVYYPHNSTPYSYSYSDD